MRWFKPHTVVALAAGVVLSGCASDMQSKPPAAAQQASKANLAAQVEADPHMSPQAKARVLAEMRMGSAPPHFGPPAPGGK